VLKASLQTCRQGFNGGVAKKTWAIQQADNNGINAGHPSDGGQDPTIEEP